MTWLFSSTSFQFASMRVEGLDANGDAVGEHSRAMT
jgi:hypothetical protein